MGKHRSAGAAGVERTPTSIAHGDFVITPRSFEIRGTSRWTLDLLIARRSRIRAFSGPETYASEQAAIRACIAFGRRIIDGRVPHCSVADLR